MVDIDQIFKGQAEADVFGRGNYMQPGVYVVETKNLFVKNGFKGNSFIAEFTIIESSNPAHAPGTTGSWVLKFAWPATLGHITKFVMACLGVEPTKENLDNPKIRKQVEVVTRASCGSDTARAELGAKYQPGMLNGIRLQLECSLQKTNPKPGKPEGGDFTSYSWSPVQSDDN